jgi:hypothetical protein
MNTHKKSSVLNLFLRAFGKRTAILVLITTIAQAERLDVPAGSAQEARAGVDNNSYVLHGNWDQPPSGGDSKLFGYSLEDSTVTGSISVNRFDQIHSVVGLALTIEGGITNSGADTSYLILNPAERSTITIQKNPINLPRGLEGLILFGAPGQPGNVNLNVGMNEWGGAIIQEGKLLTSVPNALAPSGTLMVYGELDLNGYDQAVGTLADDLPGGASPGNTSGLITSGRPATLTVEQRNLVWKGNDGAEHETKGNYFGSITGRVSLVKLGDATLTLGGEINIGGGIAVKSGALAVVGTIKAARFDVSKGAKLSIRVNPTSPSIITDSVSFVDSALNLISASPQASPVDRPLFLVVNNSRSAAQGAFKSVSIDGGVAVDPEKIVLNGKKFRLVYNANFDGPRSDRLANDIALVPVR